MLKEQKKTTIGKHMFAKTKLQEMCVNKLTMFAKTKLQEMCVNKLTKKITHGITCKPLFGTGG